MSQIEVTKEGLRPKTILQKQRINLVYNCEGLGGFIQWTTAMQWVYEANEHLYGTVFAPQIIIELAKRWFWHLRDRVEVKLTGRVNSYKDVSKVYGPRFILPEVFQLHNTLGAHPLRIGFEYFANIDYIPEGYARLPEIIGDEVSISKFNLPEKYAVITTEATTKSRMLKSDTINGMTEHLRKLNITPVFLGKKQLTAATTNQAPDYKPYESSSPDGLNLDGVIDLREKSSLLEAACILAKSQLVAGLDNGLLHLASCSRVPVIWGFNTVNPIHRLPPRRDNAINHAIGPPESLSCRYCQSNAHARYADINHDYRECLYKDFLCLESLTKEPFIEAIDRVL